MSGLANNGLQQKRNGIAAKHKRAAVFALAAGFTLLSLTGCGRQSVHVGGTGINSPVVINYTVNNPLTNESKGRKRRGVRLPIFTSTVLKTRRSSSHYIRIKEVLTVCGSGSSSLPGIMAAVDEGAEITRVRFLPILSGISTILVDHGIEVCRTEILS
jgi:hypothetical protein